MTFVIIIAIYFVIMILIGVLNRRRAQNADGFFVAGRSGSTFLITGSLIATIIGGSATVGVAGLGFSRGLTGVWWLLVGSIGLIVLGILFAGKLRHMALYTLPQLVEKQYGSTVAVVSSVLIVIAWLGVIAGQIVATGKIMSVMGLGTASLWMTIFAVIFIIYTLIGGQHAGIRTDVIQAVIIFIGIFGAIFLVMEQIGGWAELTEALPADHFKFPLNADFGGIELLSYLLLIGLTYVVGPDMYSKLFSSRNSHVARKSAIIAALIIIPFAFGITIIGMGAAALFPKISPEQAFPTLILNQFPPLFGGLLLAALISATMSSADSCLISGSTILSINIAKAIKPELSERSTLLIAKISVILLGILALLLALVLKGVISALLFAYTVYTGGVIVAVLAGFYRDKLKVTPLGALVSIIGGGATAVISKLFVIQYLDMGSLAVAAILLFTVSLIDRKLIHS